MADSYTVFWTRERCDRLRRLGRNDRRLEVLSPSLYVQAMDAFDRYRNAYPDVLALAPTCTGEVVECEDSIPLRFDVAVSPDLLARMRYRSKRRERDLGTYIRDGRLVQSVGVQGIYRLTEATARELETLLM
jgi:hypothetical protein